jgi:hypothetical protein
MERKPRENTGIHMNEAHERFRPALLLGKHATGHRPLCVVGLDCCMSTSTEWSCVVIEISGLSVSIGGHKNALRNCNIMTANIPFNSLTKFI